MKKYKRHPKGLDLFSTPQPILKRYKVCCEYKYFKIDEFGEIPVPLFAIKGLNYNNTDIYNIPIQDYANGFIEGYNSNLVPFVDTSESRKEVILKEAIFKGSKGFLESHTKMGLEYRSTDMFESGLFEGKRYKAWEIIFETPGVFLGWFLPNEIPDESQNEILEKSKKVIEALEKFKLFEYLEGEGFEPNKVYLLIHNHAGRELMPYTIALLKEIGYLKYFFNEFGKTKKEGHGLLSKAFEVNERRIRGNINILNPSSEEDPLQYTSHTHNENVQKELKGL